MLTKFCARSKLNFNSIIVFMSAKCTRDKKPLIFDKRALYKKYASTNHVILDNVKLISHALNIITLVYKLVVT